MKRAMILCNVRISFIFSACCFALSAFSAEPPREIRPALAALTPDGILQHMRVLASDEFEGRAPATPGEEKTVAYLTGQFQRLGLRPGNPDGTYVQEVPMIGSTAEAAAWWSTGAERKALAVPNECVLWTKRVVPSVTVTQSDLVFVGYGVVAPEYGWDDYKNVDVRGKTILMLINDPQVPDRGDPAKLDPAVFKGRAMTYYGRWTYKFEIAAEKGATAAIIIHETPTAGYPWGVVQDSNSRENFDLERPDRNMSRAAVEGWIHLDAAGRLLRASGLDFERLKSSANSRDFQPVALGTKMGFAITNTLRNVGSRNVIARFEGSDPQLKNEHVVYSAHWDHLGRDPKLQGDQIFNGALDNASGTAMLLELARAYTKLPNATKRSILFLAPTAEEKGLLGAKYYATHPLWPIDRTVADLNIDSINAWGRTRDIQVVGPGNSSLEDLLAGAAATQNRVIIPEFAPENGYFYRADHFEFCRVGVPALYFFSGVDFVDKPKDFGPNKTKEYISQRYHKVTDEMRPDWDLSGALQDAALLFEVGWSVAQNPKRPEWKQDSEFKSRRSTAVSAKAATAN